MLNFRVRPSSIYTASGAIYLFPEIAMSRFLSSASGLPAFYLLLLLPTFCYAQSTVIQLPGESPTDQAELQPMSQGVIPNSFTPQLRKAEQLMSQLTPQTWRSEKKAGNLVRMMNQAGLQVVLEESAADNNLHDETLLRLALRSASIHTNLRFALRPYQCDYVITDAGIIRIMSADEILDVASMNTVTFDTSPIARDYDGADSIMNLIRNTIDPDYWEMNGGVGRMHLTTTRKGFLLTATQDYQHHRQVRQLLENTFALGGGAVPGNDSMVAFDGTSQPVRLPEEYLALRRNRRGMSLPGSGTTSGFGGGGAMRGGGVF